MEGVETCAPDERLFRDDLAAGAFTTGEDRGYWRLHSFAWPIAVIEVAPAALIGGPEWFALRFDLTGYPQAPTAQLWDIADDVSLAPARWPAGGERITLAFNPGWRADALYIPVDRLALAGHDAWLERYACHVWDAAGDITQYLRLVHGLLNDGGYRGVRG
jgi:hypothetical protein